MTRNAASTICYEAFTAIANQHNFPPDLPSAEVTIGLIAKLIADPRFYAIVAEIDHQVVGSNFMDERSAIAGIGPITIDPTVQNKGIGRALMRTERAADRTPFTGDKNTSQLLQLPVNTFRSPSGHRPVWNPIRHARGFQKLIPEPEPETIYQSLIGGLTCDLQISGRGRELQGAAPLKPLEQTAKTACLQSDGRSYRSAEVQLAYHDEAGAVGKRICMTAVLRKKALAARNRSGPIHSMRRPEEETR